MNRKIKLLRSCSGIFGIGFIFSCLTTAIGQSPSQPVILTTALSQCEDDPACRENCGPETACGRYYQKYCELFDQRDWELYKYKLFIDRFDAKSCPNGMDPNGCRVRVTLEGGIPKDIPPLDPIQRRDWYFDYRYRERQMDKERAWRGIYSAYLEERETYLKGHAVVKQIFEMLMAQSLSDKEINKELNQPASFLLPGDESRAKLKLKDLIYIYLGEDAQIALKKKVADQRLNQTKKRLDGDLKQADQQARSEIQQLLQDAQKSAPAEDHTFLVPKPAAPPSEPDQNLRKE